MDTIGHRNTSWFNTPVGGAETITRPGATRPTDEVAAWVEQCISADTAYRREVGDDAEWDTYVDFYEGEQWASDPTVGRGNDWRAKITVNMIKPTVDSQHATLMNQDPTINVYARAQMQADYAQTVQMAIDSVLSRRKGHQKIGDAELNALLVGNGYLKVMYDETLENGLGDIDLRVVPSQNLFVAPGSESFEEVGAEWVREVNQRSLSYIRERFPEKGHLVKAESPMPGSFEARQENPGQAGFGQAFRWKSAAYGGDNPLIGDKTTFTNPPWSTASKGESYANLHEIWHSGKGRRIRKTATQQFVDPQTGMPFHQIIEWEDWEYPLGRLIHYANGVVLSDVPAPHIRPYVLFQDNRIGNRFYATGEVKHILPLQLELNKRRSQMIDWANLMSNPVWIVDRMSGTDPEQFTNRPGAIIDKQPGTEVRREPPPPMPNYLPQMAQMPIQDAQYISGAGSAAMGIPQKGVRSGAGFAAAQDIATSRIQAKGRNLEQSIADLGRIIISLIQQYYTVSRMIRVIGDAGRVRFIQFDGMKARGDWDIVVTTGSTQAQTRAARAQLAMQAWTAQLIDRRAALTEIEFPQAEEILRRMGEGTVPMQNGTPSLGAPNPNRSDVSGYGLTIRGAPAVAEGQGQPVMGPPMGGMGGMA